MYKLGIVKSFNSKLGYGFVNVKDEDRDIIVHYSSINGDHFKNLKSNQKVFVDYFELDGKLRAKEVKALKCMKKQKLQ